MTIPGSNSLATIPGMLAGGTCSRPGVDVYQTVTPGPKQRANSDSIRISFFSGTKGGLAQKLSVKHSLLCTALTPEVAYLIMWGFCGSERFMQDN